MSEERLDRLIAELARARPVLDDLTRARVAAHLEAARAAPVPARRTTRWKLALGGALAAALAITAGLALHARPRTAALPVSPLAELPDGHLLATVRGASARGGVAGAVLTLFGPGWAVRNDRRIVADAETLVVDRPGGDAALELAVRAATIRVQNAKFLVESADVVRVTVMRGEIVLRCAGDTERHVAANELASCDPAGPPIAQPLVAAAGAPAKQLVAIDAHSAYGAEIADDVPARRAPPPRYSVAITAGVARRTAAALASRPPALGISRAPRAAPDPEQPNADGVPAPGTAPHLDRATDRAASSAAATSLRALPPSSTAGTTPTASPLLADGASSRLATSLRPLPAHLAAPSALPSSQTTAAGDTAERYAAAERLMAKNPAAARAALRDLVADAPDAPEVPNALFELANLAARAHDTLAAHAALDRLDKHPGAGALVMPASYLRCYLAPDTAEKLACYARFRAAHPASAYDADILARLASGYASAGDCKRAMPLLAEYARRYPDKENAATLLSMTKTCADAPP